MGKTEIVIVLLLTAFAAEGKLRRYDDYKVFKVTPKTNNDVHRLQMIDRKMDVWLPSNAIGKHAHVMANQSEEATLRSLFHDDRIEEHISNVQLQIDREIEEMLSSGPFLAGMDAKEFQTDKYHTYDEISAWMDALVSEYPSLASTGSAGKTYENNDIKFIKLGAKNSQGKTKPAFWIDGCIHAREWAACSTVVWVINELVTGYATNPTYKTYLDTIDFYLLPIFNVDGYKYTHTSERLWRKTRTPQGDGCYGVDPNRNWDYEWDVAGASDSPCSEIYAGPSAFSEPCVKNVANFLKSNTNIKAYMNLHTYSCDWFYPYAYAPDTYPPNHQQQVQISDAAVQSIESTHNEQYTDGSAADILYAASGSSFDWTQDKAGILLSFGAELRPHRNSFYGFQLPASQIVPTAQETWAGLQSIVEAVMKLA